MVQKSTLDFLKNLKKNNTKEWFEANKKQYEAAKADVLKLASECLASLAKIEPEYSELEPKKCLFRINRDVRFSHDKSPYKTNMGIVMSLGGKKSGGAGFYIHLEPGNSFVGGGIWGPEAEALRKIRQEIDYNFKGFNAIVSSKKFKDFYGELNTEGALKNPPKGYEAENPAIKYLKMKHFVVGKPLKDSELVDKVLLKTLTKGFETINPFLKFLNTSVGEE